MFGPLGISIWSMVSKIFLKCIADGTCGVTFVFSILDQQQKQTIPFSGGRCMGEFDGRIFVTTSRDVYYLLAIPVEKQVGSCLYGH